MLLGVSSAICASEAPVWWDRGLSSVYELILNQSDQWYGWGKISLV